MICDDYSTTQLLRTLLQNSSYFWLPQNVIDIILRAFSSVIFIPKILVFVDFKSNKKKVILILLQNFEHEDVRIKFMYIITKISVAN